jgi:hypothetical protein
MDYEKPEVIDYGDLLELTAASGIAGVEDGAGKRVRAGVDGVAEVSVGILP